MSLLIIFGYIAPAILTAFMLFLHYVDRTFFNPFPKHTDKAFISIFCPVMNIIVLIVSLLAWVQRNDAEQY